LHLLRCVAPGCSLMGMKWSEGSRPPQPPRLKPLLSTTKSCGLLVDIDYLPQLLNCAAGGGFFSAIATINTSCLIGWVDKKKGGPSGPPSSCCGSVLSLFIGSRLAPGFGRAIAHLSELVHHVLNSDPGLVLAAVRPVICAGVVGSHISIWSDDIAV
jgi:hypothetical protein